jgi:hypothetical protein
LTSAFLFTTFPKSFGPFQKYFPIEPISETEFKNLMHTSQRNKVLDELCEERSPLTAPHAAQSWRKNLQVNPWIKKMFF